MIGIDEVGRGSWAGPLVVVAARLIGELPKGVADSKLLSKKKRELPFHDIKLTCDIGEGWVTPIEIDVLGLTKAMELAVERSLIALGADPSSEIIMDGNINYCPSNYVNVKTVVDADANFPVVSAASIYAKVVRDNYMAEQAKIFPAYSFEKHVGYGTAVHIAALKQNGVCNIHRMSYKPIQKIVSKSA